MFIKNSLRVNFFKKIICLSNIFFLILPSNLLFAKTSLKTYTVNGKRFVYATVDSNKNGRPEAITITGPKYREHFFDRNRNGRLDEWVIENKNYIAHFKTRIKNRFRELTLTKKNKNENINIYLSWNEKNMGYRLLDIYENKHRMMFSDEISNSSIKIPESDFFSRPLDYGFPPCEDEKNKVESVVGLDLLSVKLFDAMNCSRIIETGSRDFSKETFQKCIDNFILDPSCSDNPNKKFMLEGIYNIFANKGSFGSSSYIDCLNSHGKSDYVSKLMTSLTDSFSTLEEVRKYTHRIKCVKVRSFFSPASYDSKTKEIFFYGSPEDFNVKKEEDKVDFYSKLYAHEMYHGITGLDHPGLYMGEFDEVETVDKCCTPMIIAKELTEVCREKDPCKKEEDLSCRSACFNCDSLINHEKSKLHNEWFKMISFVMTGDENNPNEFGDFWQGLTYFFGSKNMEKILKEYRENLYRKLKNNFLEFCRKGKGEKGYNETLEKCLQNIDVTLNSCQKNFSSSPACSELAKITCKSFQENLNKTLSDLGSSGNCYKILDKENCDKLSKSTREFIKKLAENGKENSCLGTENNLEPLTKILPLLILSEKPLEEQLNHCPENCPNESGRNVTQKKTSTNANKNLLDELFNLFISDLHAESDLNAEPDLNAELVDIRSPNASSKQNECLICDIVLLDRKKHADNTKTPFPTLEDANKQFEKDSEKISDTQNPGKLEQTSDLDMTDYADYRAAIKREESGLNFLSKVEGFFETLFANKAFAADFKKKEDRPIFFKDLYSPDDPYASKNEQEISKRNIEKTRANKPSDGIKRAAKPKNDKAFSDMKRFDRRKKIQSSDLPENRKSNPKGELPKGSGSIAQGKGLGPVSPGENSTREANKTNLFALKSKADFCSKIQNQKQLEEFILVKNDEVYRALNEKCFIDKLNEHFFRIIVEEPNKAYGHKKPRKIFKLEDNVFKRMN